MGKYDFTGLMDGEKNTKENSYDFSGLMDDVSELEKVKPSIEKAGKVFGSKTLGNIAMTANAAGAASRAAARVDPRLALAGPFAGLSAMASAKGTPSRDAALQAIQNPSDVPTYNEQFAQIAAKLAGHMPKNIAGGLGAYMSGQAQGLGTLADIATNPLDVALSMIGKVPGVSQAGKTIGKVATETYRKGKYVKNLIKQVGKYEKFAKKLPQDIISTARRSSVAKSGKAIKIIEEHTNAAIDMAKKNRNTLESDITKLVQEKIPNIKEASQKYIKNLSDTYEQGYNAIIDSAKGKIQNTDLYNWGKEFISKYADDTDMAGTPQFKAVKSFFNSFKSKESKLLDASGTPMSKTAEDVAFDVINGKRKDLLRGRKYTGESARRGEGILDSFNDEFKAFVGKQTKSDAFTKLQEEFSPLLNEKKSINSWVKPYGNQSSKLEKLLVKYGKGKELTLEEQGVIKTISDVSSREGYSLDDVISKASEFKKSGEKIASVKSAGTQSKIAEKARLAVRKEQLSKRSSTVKHLKERYTAQKSELEKLTKPGFTKKATKHIASRLVDAALYWFIFQGSFKSIRKAMESLGGGGG